MKLSKIVTGAALATVLGAGAAPAFAGEMSKMPPAAIQVYERAACPVHADFYPLSPTFLVHPFAVLASLPARPVCYAPSIDYYVIT